MARTNQEEAAFPETYKEALSAMGRCYDPEELLVLNQFYAPALVYLETGLTKNSVLSVDDKKSLAREEMWLGLLEIASKLSINQEDFDYLRECAIWLEDHGFVKMSGFIELFLLTLHKFVEERPPDSHCHFEVVSLECDDCGHESDHLFWSIINTTLREDLRQLVRTGEFFKHRCPYCGHIDARCGIFFYCDPNRDEYLLLVPPGGDDLIKAAEDGTAKYLEDLDTEFRGNKSNVAFVSGYIGAPWKNAEDFNIVSHVQDARQLIEIVNAHFNLDVLVTAGDNVLDPTYMTADHEFRAKNYEKAVVLYAKAFLNNQKQVAWLYSICAALQNLGKIENAAFLKRRADELRLKLRETGVMFDTRANWSFNQTREGQLITMQIDKTGLPCEWGFEDIVLFLRKLSEAG